MTLATPLLAASGVTFRYPNSASDFALRGVDVSLAAGEVVVITGRSGAGKTTLLRVLAGLETPMSGNVTRTNDWAYVPQDLALVEYLTALENVMFPLHVQSVPYDLRRQQAHDALMTLGLSRHEQQRPSQLSGGQQQRVAIARAIAGTPPVLLADEPTGQLDSTSSKNVMDIIHELSRASNIGAIVTTHDPIVVARADRVLEIHDGRVLPVGH